MIAKSLLAALAVASLVAVPALAQTTANDPERNGHHYQGGPKTDLGRFAVRAQAVMSKIGHPISVRHWSSSGVSLGPIR